MDVEYEATIYGEQKDIMDDALSKSKSKIMMGQFYEPIYKFELKILTFIMLLLGKNLNIRFHSSI